ATSIITLLGTFAVVLGAVSLFRLRPSDRRVALGLAIVAAAVLAIMAWQLGAFAGVLDAFGKDSTLTGRTFLWRGGIVEGSRHPLLGMGYLAFWTPGHPPAERLWEAFYITGK